MDQYHFLCFLFFFFQAEDGIRDLTVTGVQTCALPISMRFLWSILLPLSKANMAALFVILFVYGWNDYLWPLMITNTPEMRTAVIGIESLVPRTSQLPEWNIAMAAAMMVLLPPVAVIVLMQRWFVKGLIESEK